MSKSIGKWDIVFARLGCFFKGHVWSPSYYNRTFGSISTYTCMCCGLKKQDVYDTELLFRNEKQWNRRYSKVVRQRCKISRIRRIRYKFIRLKKIIINK